jgi:hypothetical protein
MIAELLFFLKVATPRVTTSQTWTVSSRVTRNPALTISTRLKMVLSLLLELNIVMMMLCQTAAVLLTTSDSLVARVACLPS